MTAKLYIQTHGCQMNEYDSSRMRDLLRESHDLVPTEDPEEADVLLLNTCSIREKAQEKVFHQLGRWKRLKARKPGLVIDLRHGQGVRQDKTRPGAPGHSRHPGHHRGQHH